MDVSDHASVEAAFADMPALDVVVNNAGVSHEGPTENIAEDEWDRVVDTNLKGVWAVSKFAIQQWKRDERPGSLVNNSSILGLRVGGRVAAYTASKARLFSSPNPWPGLRSPQYSLQCHLPGLCGNRYQSGFLTARWLKKCSSAFLIVGWVISTSWLARCCCWLPTHRPSYMSGAIIAVDGGHLCNTL